MNERPPERVGAYRLVEKLGEGGMGVVYRAHDERLGRDVAVKVLKRERAVDAHRLRRFTAEARAMAAVSHPNIVAIHDVGTWDGRPFIVTEFFEGETLKDRIRSGALTVATAVEYAIQVVRGLGAAHERGVVHRDLKTENVFVTCDGQVKLLDFGIATLVETDPRCSGDTGGRNTAREDTQPGDMAGTPGCMSPEQIRGLPVDQRADIFAVGVLLHEMLSGRRPFAGATPGETMAMVLHEDPPALGRPVPEDLAQIVSRCLEKRPEDRFSSAHDLSLALRAIAARGLPARRARMRPRATGAGRPWRRVAWFAVVAALAALTIVGFRSFVNRSDRGVTSADLIPNRIAVVPFACTGSCGEDDPLGTMAAVRLVTALARLKEVEVVRTEEGSAYPITSSPAVQRIAAATEAGIVLSGGWRGRGDEVEFSASLEDAASGRVVALLGPASASRDAPWTALEVLCDQALIAIQYHLHPSLAFGAGDRWPRIDAFREYRRSLEATKSAPLEVVFEHLERALQLDPEFTQARLMFAAGITIARPEVVGPGLVSAYLPRLLQLQYDRLSDSQVQILHGILFRIDGDWLGASQLFQQVLDRDSRNCVSRMLVIDSALRANRPQQAIDTFEDWVWDPILPPQPRESTLSGAAKAYHLLGRHDEEREVIHRLEPGPVRGDARLWALSLRLDALAAAGNLEPLERAVEDVLVQPTRDPLQRVRVLVSAAEELREHGHPDAATRVAERALEVLDQPESGDASSVGFVECRSDAMYLAGRADDAYAMVLASAEGWPDSSERSRVIGLAAARAGDRDAALAHVLDISGSGGPFTFGESDYVRARIAALAGDRREVMRLLRRAIVNGFWDYPALRRCPDLESLREDPGFRRLIAPKG